MELNNQGTIFNPEKTKKLEYSKKGSSYEVDIFEIRKQQEKDITKRTFVRVNDFKLRMSRDTLINYLNTELHINK